MNLKISKIFEKIAQNWENRKAGFRRRRFHLMRQSELKVRANKQFYLVDNDAQRIGELSQYCMVQFMDIRISCTINVQRFYPSVHHHGLFCVYLANLGQLGFSIYEGKKTSDHPAKPESKSSASFLTESSNSYQSNKLSGMHRDIFRLQLAIIDT